MDQYRKDEARSTLKENDRKAVWSSLENIELELSLLKGIAQNPGPLTNHDLSEWAVQAERVRKKLKDLQQSVIMIASARINNGTDIPGVVNHVMDNIQIDVDTPKPQGV